MIRHVWPLNYYSIDFPNKTSYLFWELKQAERALRKWLKSKSK